MKILRIIARLNVGGPARHVVWLTEELNDDEFESLLIAGTVPAGEEDMNYIAAEHGVRPLFIEEMSRELSLKDAISLYKVFREMRRYRPDIVHTHTAKAGTVGRAAAFLYRLLNPGKRVRIVHTFHGHVFHSYYGRVKTKVFLTIEKLLARVATDKIIVISPQQLREIHEQFGVGREQQFEVIPLGIDLDAFRPNDEKRQAFRSELSIRPGELLIGFVGRLTEIKDISLYLQVAARAARLDDGPRLRFVIAGDGHLRRALEAEAAELGLGESMHFLGNRTDADTVYAGLDIVALTSLNEGTPLSLIEAMAAERPVISTVVGGVRDLLGRMAEEHDGFQVFERGIGVPGRDPGDFLKGLIYLTKNERLRERLVVESSNFVHHEYAKRRLVADIKQLYRKLTSLE